MTNILFFSKITLVCKYNGGRAEIALNNLGFLIVFYYTVIIKTRCSPASEFRNSETCDPPATARHERAGRGGRVSGVLHHLMGREIERKRLFIDKRDRQDFNIRLHALACKKLCTFCTSVPYNPSVPLQPCSMELPFSAARPGLL